MRKLITDLLDMTQIESGLKSRELGVVDVAAVARGVIETMMPEAVKKRVAVELHADGSVAMTADAGELEMILNNLVSNAIKYNRDGGRVDMTVGRSGNEVTVRVADTGIGMTPHEAGKLFDEFVRIKNKDTRNVLGSGLGLSIVRKLALLYGGDATVESQPVVGSTFTGVLNDVPQSPS